MKPCDKRILGRMQEDERTQYEQDLHKNLPDLLDVSEFVDTHILMAQLPSRREKAVSRDNNAGSATEAAQELEG